MRSQSSKAALQGQSNAAFGKHPHPYEAQRLSGARYIVLLQWAYAHGSAMISLKKSIAERFWNRYKLRKAQTPID